MQPGLLQTLAIVLTCITWTIISSLAILVNRHVMVSLHFPYPTTIALLGLVTTTGISFLAIHIFIQPSDRITVTRERFTEFILPAGMAMAMSFLLGNSAYLYLTVSFIQMLKASAPVVTMLLLLALNMEVATSKLVMSVGTISLGVAIASYGEIKLNWIGISLMLLSVFAESCRLVMMQRLITGGGKEGKGGEGEGDRVKQLHPIEGLAYIGLASSLCLAGLSFALDSHRIVEDKSWQVVAENPLSFAIVAFAGVGVNASAIMVVKLSSSLTLKVIGTVKDACLITAGVLFLGEMVSSVQFYGYLISVIGFLAYNIIKATS